MTKNRTRYVVLALAAAALVAGCAPLATVDCASNQYYGWIPGQGIPLTPRLDCGFGDAVNMGIARQTLDPGATARNAAKDAAGMDGIAAREALDRYQRSFRSPEPTPNALTIGVGGSQGSGGTQ